MKKKIVLGLTAVALATLMIVGGTLAWFTDKAEATNVISFGKVDVTLAEPNYHEKTDAVNVVPGDVITKDPTITNEGEAVYIRVKVDYTGSDSVFSTVENLDSILGINNSLWVKLGDYYYYIGNDGILAKGAASITLFEKVSIPTNWNNTFASKTLNIKVYVEALQVDNNPVVVTAGNTLAERIAALYTGVTIEAYPASTVVPTTAPTITPTVEPTSSPSGN